MKINVIKIIEDVLVQTICNTSIQMETRIIIGILSLIAILLFNVLIKKYGSRALNKFNSKKNYKNR